MERIKNQHLQSSVDVPVGAGIRKKDNKIRWLTLFLTVVMAHSRESLKRFAEPRRKAEKGIVSNRFFCCGDTVGQSPQPYSRIESSGSGRDWGAYGHSNGPDWPKGIANPFYRIRKTA